MAESQVYQQVQKHYSSAAKTNDDRYGRDVATAFGYSKEELASIPQDANLGLSCGNPLALAQLREVFFFSPPPLPPFLLKMPPLSHYHIFNTIY